MPAIRPDRLKVHPYVEASHAELRRLAAEGRKRESSIWRSLVRAVERISVDAQWGEVIRPVPRYFAERYEAENLYCVDLASFHRVFYTMDHREVILLDIVDHRTYDKWFPGRGR